jgi:hypothetical protein
MLTYVNVGCSPAGEKCAQVGSTNYTERASLEIQALRGQMRRLIGKEPPGAKLGIKSFPHDFGNYRELVCDFDDEDADATDYAYLAEASLPENWDDKARKELGL